MENAIQSKKKYLENLKKFESSIGEYNQVTAMEVLNLLSIDSRVSERTNKPNS